MSGACPGLRIVADVSADTVDEVIELAAHNGSYAAVDSNALQYFAASELPFDGSDYSS